MNLFRLSNIPSLLLFHLVCSVFISPTQAAAPMVKTQTPGYYRMMLGQFEVTALWDGTLDINSSVLQGIEPSEIDRLLAKQYIKGPKMPTSVNAYLVNTDKHLVLIDTGSGKTFGPGLGRLAKSFKASGYDPAQVDTVLITHLHGDHMGGLIDPAGKPAFPSATVYVPKTDNDLWVAKAKPKGSQTGRKNRPTLASRIATPYLAMGKWKTFEDGQEIVPGIKAVAAVGHTPGHSTFEVTNGKEKLVILGDVIHSMAVQLPRPDVSVRFDANQKRAIASRKAILKQLADEKTLIAGAHLPFPGIGRLRADGPDRYTWVSIIFSPCP